MRGQTKKNFSRFKLLRIVDKGELGREAGSKGAKNLVKTWERALCRLKGG